MHIHGLTKRANGKQQYASMEAIGQQFVREVQAKGQDISNSPWPLTEAKSAESAQHAMKVLELGPDGSIDQKQLKMLGFELDKTIQLKKHERGDHGPLSVYHITNIAERLQLLAADDAK